MSTVIKDLGAVSAYAYAVEKGYTGTEAEFAELMADYADVGQRAEDAAESALNSKTAAQTAQTGAETAAASVQSSAAQIATNAEDISQLKSDLNELTTATAEDVGKALKAKTVTDGKVTEWEFGEAGGNNELLDNLSFDTDNAIYHRNGEEYTKKVQFADGAIINGNMDTQPVIVAHGKGLYTGDPQAKAGLCVTKTYPIGEGYTIIYYLSNPESVSASGINRYQDMDGTTVLASRNVTVDSATETPLITGNGIRFTLYEAGVNDSYAYIKQTGDVLFAGEDSAYFGMRNIDGTKASSATLISDKNAEDKLLSRAGLIVGKDGLVHLAYDGGASAGIGIQFADDAIVNAQYDTKIHIAEYGKLINGVTPYVPRLGGCYTEFYDLVSENAVIKYYFPNPDGASFSNNNKIEWYRGDIYVGRSNETLNSVAEASCSNTETKANKFRVSLATAGIDDSYCYDKATGTVIFAGKNTAYYGLNNIADQPDPDPRDYGVIGANYPEETALIESSLANAQTYGDKTGITNRFAFCHVSDVHMHSASVRGFGYADEFTDLSDAAFLALTGDNVSNTATDTFDHAKALIDGMTKPCYITFGNHDVYGSTSLSSRFDHQFAQIKDHNGQSTLSTTYYAVDIALGKQAEKLDTGGVNDDCNGIKCLFLDCYDGVDDYTGQNMSYVCDGHMSATQINWLATQLQDAITNKYHVCIFMHHAPDDCSMMIDKFFDSHGYASNLLFIAKMVDAFQTYNGSVTFEHMGASYTFTFSGSGHFVSYFVGHTHCDGACWLKSYPRQLSVGIVTPTGSGSGMNGTNMNTGLGVMFNYVTIDKKKRKVTVFRVGNQDTYYGYKRDLFSVRYY